MSYATSLQTLERRLGLTREGLVWLALCVGMLATGLIKGINLITLLGCILLAAGVLNIVLARRQLRGLEVSRALPDFLVADLPDTWRLEVRAADGRIHHGVHVAEPGLSEAAETTKEWFLDQVTPAGQAVDKIVHPRRRGIVRLP